MPRVINVYREKNAVHLLYDRPLVCTLLYLIEDATMLSTPIEKDATVGYIMGCVLSAVQALHHMTILYRSLHPEAIMIDDKGKIQLFDFGLAKVGGVGGSNYTICGVANYLAPEMVFHQRSHCEAVDLWSLGVLLYELVHGEYPFAGDNEIATYSKIAAYGHCLNAKDRRKMLDLRSSSKLEKAAAPLIEALLVPEHTDRLGMPVKGSRPKGEAALRSHSFFTSGKSKVDWKKIGIMQSPLMPRLVKAKELMLIDGLAGTGSGNKSLQERFMEEYPPSTAQDYWLTGEV
jgi:serine/threonine protein kinase